MLSSTRSAGSASSTVFFIETQLRAASPTGRPEPAMYPKHATVTENNMVAQLMSPEALCPSKSVKMDEL